MNNIINNLILLFLFNLLFPHITDGSTDSTGIKFAGTKINDTIVLFEENFNDGDFTNNPTWTAKVQQVCAPEPSQISVSDGVLKAYQSGAGRCGTSATIRINLNIPLSDSTKIQLDVKPAYSSVDEGAGWFDWEFPIFVTLYLINTNNESLLLRFGYNYRGGNSRFKKDLVSLAFTDCRQDAWLRNEVFTIRDYFPDAVSIRGITIGGMGWDYEGYIDNIVIFDCCPNSFTPVDLNKNDTVEKHDQTAVNYKSLTKDEKAIDLYSKYLRSSEINNDNKRVCQYLYIIGEMYFESGMYDSALIYFQQSYEKSKKVNSKSFIVKSLNGLTKIHFRWNQFDKALVYLNKLLDFYKEQNDKAGIIITQNEIANIYNSQGNLQKANEFYSESLKLCEENESTNLMAKTLENIGDNLQQAGQYEKALEYYQKSLKTNEKSGNINSVALLFFKIANIYSDLKKYNLSIDNLNKSLYTAQNQNLKSLESNIYFSFSEIYNNKGNNKTALGYYKLHTETKDFIKDKESNKEIAELYVKYETEKKEKEIEILKKDKKINQLKITQQKKLVQYFFIISGLVLILVFLVYNRYRINKKTNRILSNQKDKLAKALEDREIVQAELKTLNENLEKKVKEEIQKFTDQKEIFVEQSRLADIGLLAAGIAHELNNPLQSMYLSLQNMHESLIEKKADEKYFESKIKYISEDINRMKNIISHVRLFSRDYGSDIRENFNINESIENALSMFKVQYANHKIKMTISLSENINFIFGNKYKYERIVLNLLFNAKDALEEKEKITKERFQKTILLRSFQENNFVILEFKDNGIGIPQENFDKIFEAFYTTKEPGKGTGLGLSISKEIISDMGGEIKFESKHLEGTVMIVMVPVVGGEK